VGWFKDPNVFGSVLAILVIYLLFFLIHDKELKLWKGFLVLPYLGGMIFLVNSKGAMTSLIIVIIFSLIILKIKTLQKIFNQTLIALLFLIILPLSFLLNGWHKPWIFDRNPALVQKPTPIFLPHQSERREIIKKSLEIFLQTRKEPEKFLLGHGPGKSGEILNVKPYKILLTPHNTYLLVLLENGIIGLFLFLSFIFSVLYLLWKKTVKVSFGSEKLFYIFLLGGILLILIHGLVIDTLHWRHFWLILGIASALISTNNLNRQ
jgi:O-antigen ligase